MLGFLRSRSRGVDTIVVTQSAADPEAAGYALSSAVSSFFTDMVQKGLYVPSELPREGGIINHLCYYYNQVCNGGHGQFVHNSRAAPAVMADIREGLKTIRATEILDCFDQMTRWTTLHPGHEAMHGVEGPDVAELREIDTRFFALDREKHFYAPLNDWIRKTRALRVVPDAAYTGEIEKLTAANPARAQREADARIAQIHNALVDPFRASVGFFCSAQTPPLAFLRALPGSFETIFGQKSVVLGLETSDGRFNAAEIDEHKVFFRHETGLSDMSDVAGVVSNKHLSLQKRAAETHPVAVATALLLAQIGEFERLPTMGIAFQEEGKIDGKLGVLFRVIFPERRFLVMQIAPAGAALVDDDKGARVAFVKPNVLNREAAAFQKRVAAFNALR